MNQRRIFKSSLCLALIGILLLFIYTENTQLKIKNISEITKKDVDKYVKVQGQVTRVTDLEGILLFNLKDKTKEITILVFKEEPIKVQQNDFLEIEGKVTEYKGQLEIQAEKIIKI